MSARKTKSASSPTDQTNLEDSIAKTFPHLKKNQVREIAHLLQKNKGKRFAEFKGPLKIILDHPDISDYLKFMDFLASKNKIVTRKVGRPVSKVTTSKYFQDELLRRARACIEFLFDAIENSKYDIFTESQGFWIPRAYFSHFDFPFNLYAKYDRENNDLTNINKADFNYGAWWGIILNMNIVFPAVMYSIPELWSVKKHIASKMKVNEAKGKYLNQQIGFTDEMMEEFVKAKNKKLPGDHVKKNRKPKYSAAEIARFTRAVKSLKMPTPDKVSIKLKLSVNEVMSLFDDSVKKRKGITLENTNKGKIFVMK